LDFLENNLNNKRHLVKQKNTNKKPLVTLDLLGKQRPGQEKTPGYLGIFRKQSSEQQKTSG
jgi:hypothetical protein